MQTWTAQLRLKTIEMKDPKKHNNVWGDRMKNEVA